MKAYFKLWTISRFIQLLIGFYFIWEYYQHPSYLALIFGGLMLFQAIMNVGCFSSKGCAIPKNTESYNEDADIDFEEVE